jgi:L-ascorbate metabolism protein UlaG (beta-lactamase superfamily)
VNGDVFHPAERTAGMIRHDGLSVEWLGFATVRIEGEGCVVYLDPGRYGVLDDYDGRDGDLVFVTHAHHYDPDGIRRVAKEDATVVVFEGMDLRGGRGPRRDLDRPADLPFEVREVGAEEDFLLGDVVVRTVDAYNEEGGPHTRPDGTPLHPKGRGCGYHLTVPSAQRDGGVRVFWPGDSDVLAGHERLDVSLFLPPIGGVFTMDRHEAAALAEAMAPDLVLPIHYDTFEAIETDARAFAADVASRGVPVVLDSQD